MTEFTPGPSILDRNLKNSTPANEDLKGLLLDRCRNLAMYLSNRGFRTPSTPVKLETVDGCALDRQRVRAYANCIGAHDIFRRRTREPSHADVIRLTQQAAYLFHLTRGNTMSIFNQVVFVRFDFDALSDAPYVWRRV